MTKKELVDSILAKLNKGSRLEVESVLENFTEVAAKELIGGGEVGIPGLGKLKVRATRPRKGYNPFTGKQLDLPASRKVVFVAYDKFKKAIKEN